MPDHKQDFIRFAIANNVLAFGEFSLKSGRISPYFFNAGRFHHGDSLAKLGHFYAATLTAANLHYDMVFGPAYKGIPLVCATAMALAQEHNINTPYSFNRKETKDHGEGGDLVGAPLQGDVVIIDDVITAGTAIRKANAIINQHGAKVAGIIVALDRKERGHGTRSAIQEIEHEYGIPVIPIITLDDIIHHIHAEKDPALIAAIQDYQANYGI